MRRKFADELYKWMQNDEDIVVVTCDLGYKMFDAIRERFPDRFYNVGAAEQAGMGVAVGLALKGKKPFIYSITPFLLYRPFETIRNYINHEKIAVRLVGGGRDDDYKHDGYSHYAGEDKTVIENCFPNITRCWPMNDDQVVETLNAMVTQNIPWYVNLRR